ncbi:unnamed protein product [Diamesa hyperborea]
MMQQTSAKRQYFVALFTNLLAFSYGASCGWNSPSIPILESDDSPLNSGPVTSEESSIIGSILCLGGLVGTLLFGWLMERIGRKISICITAIPQAIAWFLIFYIPDLNVLIFSRFLSGLAGGGIFVIVPVYIAEISEDRIRGLLGSTLVFCCNMGLFSAYVFGTYFSYSTVPLIFIPFSLLFLVCFLSVPETPLYLMKQNKYKEAEKSLKYFRCISEKSSGSVAMEFQGIKSSLTGESNKVTMADFATKSAKKAIIYGIVLMALNQFCGCFAMLNFTVSIFKESGSNLSPNLSSILVGLIQIFGSFVPTLLVDKLGRKFLLAFSAFGTSIGLGVLGIYSYMKTLGYDLHELNWIPLVSFSFVIFIANFGVLTLPFLILSEISPPKTRGPVMTIASLWTWVAGFLLIKFYPAVEMIIGLHSVMWMFSVMCVFCGLFTLFFLPETNGKRWLSPSLLYLQSSESHLQTGAITSEESSWIGALLCVGGFIGTIAFGFITEKLGKKVALMILVIPHMTSWTLIYFSTQVHHLYIARICAGITGGGTMRTVSLYVAEIAENNIRGILGSFFILAVNLGVLFSFIAGAYLDFFIVPLLMIVIPTTFIVALTFLPDTPQSLIIRNKPEDAWESMNFYRCSDTKFVNEDVKLEFQLMVMSLTGKNSSLMDAVTIKDFMTKPALKGIFIGLSLMFLNQFSGCFAIITYTADIFKRSGSILSPNQSSIIVASIQLLGSYVALNLVDRFGRKILLGISSGGTGFFLGVLGIYSYLDHTLVDLSKVGFIPILSLSLAIFVASIGIITMPFIVLAEISPQKIRNACCTICMAFITVAAFIVLKIFPLMVSSVELYGCMFIFSAICFVGLLVIVLFLPETKGKNLIEN